MTKEKKLRRLRHLLSRILIGLSWLVLTVFSVIIFIIDFEVKSWFFSLFQGLFAIFFLAVLPSMLDFRQDTRVEENGIWFRDYKVMIPYSYIEKGEFYKGRSHGCTEYEVDIFLSSKVFEDGQINTCKLQKKLKGENRIRVLLVGGSGRGICEPLRCPPRKDPYARCVRGCCIGINRRNSEGIENRKQPAKNGEKKLVEFF